MSEGREALSRDANSNAKASKGAGDRGARNPWVSSRLVRVLNRSTASGFALLCFDQFPFPCGEP